MSVAPAPQSMPSGGFYHCSVKGVGRSKGRSVVAAAAYRSGERFVDERTGDIADYRARGGVLDSFVIAPENAPAWSHDIGRLWNEAERAEDRANGRVANEIVIALPHELDAEARRAAAEEYVREIVKKHGVAAHVSLHAPDREGDQRNWHAHILFTHRELGVDGFGDIANERVIQKKVPVKGHDEAQYRPRTIAGIAATPADIVALRKEWEAVANRAYERAGLDIRVDHRSHDDRGLEREPTQHLGPKATEMERKETGSSERGLANLEITARNAARSNVQELEAEVKQLSAEIIDLQAERAMREQRDAARGRYDRLRDTEREVQRDVFPGRYEQLQAATPPPEVVRVFDASANRTTEPAAPVYDRDADNAAWEAKLADAAINAGPQSGQQRPEAGKGRDGGPAAENAPDGQAAGRNNTPEPALGKTAGDIRAAWTLSRSAGQFEEALAAHGIALAEVTAEEARQSERTAAFAKEVGNSARVLAEGEIVAINQHGDIHRLNQRTTGEASPDIEARFPGIDRAALLNVADTKEVMQEAARAAWRDQRHAEREQQRSATAIETRIADALMNTMTGTEFAAALDQAGLTIARASDLDMKALDALRQDGKLAGIVAETEAEPEPQATRHFATLQAGDFAAINAAGDVFRLNPHKLDFDDIEQRLADVQSRFPSVIEARARIEITGEKTADFWADLREWNAEARITREDARAGDRALHATVAGAEHATEATLNTAGDAVDETLNAASRFGKGLAKAVEIILGGIFSFFVAEPKLTPMQAELAARANDELAEARAVAAAAEEKDAVRDWLIFEQLRQQRTEQVERETGLRERPGDRERERERY